jgi:large subunit ribosomal protein L30
MLRVKLVKSPIANTPANRRTVAALGLRKIDDVNVLPDSPSVRGMIHKVKHLLIVEAVPDPEPVETAPKRRAKKAEEPQEN